MAGRKGGPVPREIGGIIEVSEEDDADVVGLARAKGVAMMAFIGSYVPRRYSPGVTGRSRISITDEFGVEQAITEMCKKMKGTGVKKLFLLVNTTGGSLASSFKTAKAVRDAFDDITVFVPHIAASGGTLITLTGNRIVMGMMSQLSPLDVQIANERGVFSVNSCFRAKGRLDRYFSKRSINDATYTMKHMAESLDPIMLEELHGIQCEGIEYMEIILEKAGYSRSKTVKISKLLSETFPTHGFVIQYGEAKDVGLNVVKDDAYPEEWGIMRKWLSKYITRESDRHFIRYCLPR